MKSLTAVGLEIREDRTRAVELAEASGGFTIRQTADVATPPGSVVNGRVIDPVRLAAGLRELWSVGEFSTRRCVVLLASSQVMQQMITLPPAPFPELCQIVRSELERFAELNDGSYIGWLSMTAGAEVAGNSLAFLVHHGVIEGYEQALAHCDLEAAAYEPAALAAFRVLGRESLPCPRQGESFAATAVLYASGRCAELAIFEEEGLSYCRCLEVDWEKTDDDGVPSSILSEIERSLQYYSRAYRDAPQPSSLQVIGEHAAFPALVVRLGELLGLEVRHLDPLAARGPDDLLGGGDAPVAAAGGALRLLPGCPQSGSRRLELRLAREAVAEARSNAESATRFGRLALIGAGAVLVVALLATTALTVRLKQASAAHEAATVAIKTAREAREADAARRRALRADLKRLEGAALPAADLMRYLRRIVPRGAALSALELKENGALALRGEARSVDHVTALVRRLTYDLHFRAPEVESIERAIERRGITFAVQTGLVGYGLRASREP